MYLKKYTNNSQKNISDIPTKTLCQTPCKNNAKYKKKSTSKNFWYQFIAKY